MKKLSVKKLGINKSTVTNLDHQGLKDVKGGYVTAYTACVTTVGIHCTRYPVPCSN